MRQFIWAFGSRICELEKLKQLAGAQGSLQSTSPDQRLPAPAPGGGELLPFATITVAPQSNVGPRMLTADVDSKPPKGVCLTTPFGISRSQ